MILHVCQLLSVREVENPQMQLCHTKCHIVLCAAPRHRQMFQGIYWCSARHKATSHQMPFSYLALSQLLASLNAILITSNAHRMLPGLSYILKYINQTLLTIPRLTCILLQLYTFFTLVFTGLPAFYLNHCKETIIYCSKKISQSVAISKLLTATINFSFLAPKSRY